MSWFSSFFNPIQCEEAHQPESVVPAHAEEKHEEDSPKTEDKEEEIEAEEAPAEEEEAEEPEDVSIELFLFGALQGVRALGGMWNGLALIG